MISYEEFEILIDLLKKSYEESRRFNKALEEVYGEDSCVWYYTQCDIISDHVVRILELNGESHDGAEWFVYEGLEQIEKGGTKVWIGEKEYNIKTIHDYYDWLVNFSKHNTNTSELKCWKCGKTLTTENISNIIYTSNPPKYTCKDCEIIKTK